MNINRHSIIEAFSLRPLNEKGVRQVERMLQQSNGISIGGLLGMLGCIYLMRNTTLLPAMLMWLASNAFFSAIRWRLVYTPIKRKFKMGHVISRRDHSVYHVIRFIIVCIWMVGGYLFLPTVDDPQMFIGFIIIFAGVFTGAAQNNTSSTTEFPLIYAVPVGAGLVVRMLELGYLFFAILITLYMAYISFLVIRVSRLQQRAQTVELENKILLKHLTREKEKADKASAEKSNFLAAASHDLRQPLNSLGLFLYGHREQISSVKSIDLSALDGADRSLNALQELFESLTEIARFDEGAIDVSIQSVDLIDIIPPVIEELDIVASQKGVRLEHVSSSVCVASDPALLTRILRNLIGNAIKYTNAGSVVVSEVREGANLIISVRDTGVGIDEEALPYIFDEYHQVANKLHTQREGIGLGLSIVKRISNLLDHPVSVVSVPAKGSTFSVAVPLCLESSKDVVVQKPEIKVMNGLRALLIDDEIDVLKAMRVTLCNWGCEVDIAETFEQARARVEKNKPNIILSDYRMPEQTNGIELVNELMRQFDFQVPCLIISADTSSNFFERVKRAGFESMSKPVDILRLNRVISDLVIKQV